MTAQAQDIFATARPTRRADPVAARLSQRDIDGLMLCGEHYGAPVAGLPAGEQPRVVVRELPAAAFAPEPQR